MVSEKIVERMSVYRRVLLQLRAEGQTVIRSHELAALVHGKAHQVRRDVMAVGYRGTPNEGYAIRGLLESVSEFLDGSAPQGAALVGVGNLGRALLGFFAGRWRWLGIKAAFDWDPAKAGRVIQECYCYPMAELPRVVKEHGITIGILTVPGDQAQGAADALCEAGVRGLLNFAQVRLKVPASVYTENVDVTVSLEKVAYFARHTEVSPHERPLLG